MKTQNTAKYIPNTITISTFEKCDIAALDAKHPEARRPAWASPRSEWSIEESKFVNLDEGYDFFIDAVPAFPADLETGKRPTQFSTWCPNNSYCADIEKRVEKSFANTAKTGYRLFDMHWRKDDIAWKVVSSDGYIYDLRNDTFLELFFKGRIDKDNVITSPLLFVKNGSQMRLEDTLSFRIKDYLAVEERKEAQKVNQKISRDKAKEKIRSKVRKADLVPGTVYKTDFDWEQYVLYLGDIGFGPTKTFLPVYVAEKSRNEYVYLRDLTNVNNFLGLVATDLLKPIAQLESDISTPIKPAMWAIREHYNDLLRKLNDLTDIPNLWPADKFQNVSSSAVEKIRESFCKLEEVRKLAEHHGKTNKWL